VVGIMKLAGLHFSQLTVNDHSADKQSGVNLTLLFPLRQTSGRGRQQTPVTSEESVRVLLLSRSVRL